MSDILQESISQNQSVPENQSVPQNQSVPHNQSIPHSQSIPHNQSDPHNESVPQNQPISDDQSIPHNQSILLHQPTPTNSPFNPEPLISIFDPYPGLSSSEEDNPPYCLGFDLYYVNLRPEDLPIFETQAEFHRFISNRACGTIEAAMRYQQWWPFNGEGASDHLVDQLADAEGGYEDLREAYDVAVAQALAEVRRGRVCCEAHAEVLGTRRYLKQLAMAADGSNREDGKGGDVREDEEGDEEHSEEDDEEMALVADITAATAEVNINGLTERDD